MSRQNDDMVPEEYQYFWHPKHEMTLQEFLKKYKPSMIQNDGTKPWLWVEKTSTRNEGADMGEASREAIELLKEITEKVENIKNDESIPVRANKKKGLKSKKELREEVQADASAKLKEISVRHRCVHGKWLVFAPPDKVDLIWSSLATSLVEGPLSPTPAYLAKVSTCPKEEEAPNYQHVLCLYMPDVYDKDKVTEVMQVLLRKHGLNLMGVKSDLYTAIGLDSKHPSGIQSTVWKNSALMKETDIKVLKEEYFAEINAAKKASAENATTTEESGVAADTNSAAKPKPKLKKKPVKNALFDFDDEPKPDEATAVKPMKTLPVKKQPDGIKSTSEGSDSDDADTRKAKLAASKATTANKVAAKKRGKSETDEDEDEEERPTKRTLKRNSK